MDRPDILIWHQGALGDLLLAGPALLAVRRRYPRARLIGLGHPERWRLLSLTLSLDGVWDSGESRLAQLFSPGPISPELRSCLSPFQLAVVFSPNRQSPVPERLRQAGIPTVHWAPSFPEGGREAVGALQARHLAGLGFNVETGSFRLSLPENPGEAELAAFSGIATWLAVAPGSGQPAKNWPLSHYYETSRALAWEYQMGVVWLAGPAEAAAAPYLAALATAQGHVFLTGANLSRVAAVLSRCRLFLGNDSGLTHLAAALGGPRVVALFGPTNPEVWAPPGEQVRILTGPCPQAPCARGREIPCPEPQCLRDLSPEQVLEVAGEILSAGLKVG
ncbi:MAG: glycosyltransferase family 9 protein [Deltaproteobacteria bacterium]|nr:glycosyltransferase family 9 protein [Deltaproteobacteria bacterium]